jgi:hypothetical protein
MNKKQYPLNIDKSLWKQFKMHTKSEYKSLNAKLVELIFEYVKKCEKGDK